MTNSITNCVSSSGSPAPAQASLMLSDCSEQFLLNRDESREEIYLIKEAEIASNVFSFELANFKMQPNDYDEAKCPLYFIIKIFNSNEPTTYTNIVLSFGGWYEDGARFNKFYIDSTMYSLSSSNIDYSKLKLNIALKDYTNEMAVSILDNNDNSIFSGNKVLPAWYTELMEEGSISVAYSVVFGDPTSWNSLDGVYDIDLLNSKLKYDLEEYNLFFGNGVNV